MKNLIDQIENFPIHLEEFVQRLNESDLSTTIREGAWTIRQFIHHLVDSHTNSYIRIKSCLVEDNPIIQPYKEENWAELPDSNSMPVLNSLIIVQGLHKKISYLLTNLTHEQWERKLTHPEVGELTLQSYVKIFADHGYLHLNSMKNRLNWDL